LTLQDGSFYTDRYKKRKAYLFVSAQFCAREGFTMTKLSMDGTDPATWDPALDGVLAAPENHTVLYEDEAIRVISVSIAPGAVEKPHHHCLPAVFVVDRLVSVRDFNGATGEEIPLPIPKDAPLPIIAKFLAQPLHYVENLDKSPFHATRIEFKHGFPTGS
jgi:hypothetical protein